MKRSPKLHLDTDALRVDSFATVSAEAGEGTVHAHEQISVAFCPPPPTERQTCARQLSNYATCVVNCECTNAQILCRGLPSPE